MTSKGVVNFDELITKQSMHTYTLVPEQSRSKPSQTKVGEFHNPKNKHKTRFWIKTI
jgi:hypothetical protein